MRMNGGQRKTAKDELQPIAEQLLQRLHDGIRLSTRGTFKIAILDERYRRRRRPCDMIIVPDGNGQVRLTRACHVEASCADISSRALRIPSAPGFTPTGE